MEESKPKMSFAAAIRAALTQKTAAENSDSLTNKKAVRKISSSGPAAITGRPPRRTTGRGG